MTTSAAALLTEVPGLSALTSLGEGGQHQRPAPHLSRVELGPPDVIAETHPLEGSMAPAYRLAHRVWHGWAPYRWDRTITTAALTHPDDADYYEPLQAIGAQLAAEHLIPGLPDMASVIVDPISATYTYPQATEDHSGDFNDYWHALLRPALFPARQEDLIGFFADSDDYRLPQTRDLIGLGCYWTDRQWAYEACFVPLCQGAPRAWLSRPYAIGADDQLPLGVHLWPHFFVWAPDRLAVMLHRYRLPR